MHDFKRHIEFAGKLIMNSDEGSDLHHVSTIVINDEATVCNYQSKKNKAFAIVKQNGNDLSLVGYSFDSNISEDDDIPAFIKNISNSKNKSARKVSCIEKLSKNGSYLIKTKWHQLSPYLNKVPGVSGCVAISMSQVMKYYAYPAKGVNAIPAYDNMPAIPLSDMVYDWDLMLNEYDDESSADSVDEVSKLVLHTGCSVKMSYGSNASSAHDYEIVPALNNYFGYDKTCLHIENTRDNSVLTLDVLSNIFDYELRNNRPTIVNGGVAGLENHSIICDGKDDNGFYHFNSGIGGEWSGYYDLGEILNLVFSIQVGIQPMEDEYFVLQSSFPETLLFDEDEKKINLLIASGHHEGFSGNIGILIHGPQGEYISDFIIATDVVIPPSTSKTQSIDIRLPEYINNGTYSASLVIQDKRYNRSWRTPLTSNSATGEFTLKVSRKKVTSSFIVVNESISDEIYITQHKKIQLDVYSNVDDEVEVVLALWDDLGNYIQTVSEVVNLKLQRDMLSTLNIELLGETFTRGGQYNLLVSQKSNNTFLAVNREDGSDFVINLNVMVPLPELASNVIVHSENFPVLFYPYNYTDTFEVVIDNQGEIPFALQGFYIALIDDYNNIYQCGKPVGYVAIPTGKNTCKFECNIDDGAFDFKKYRLGIVANNNFKTYLLASHDGSYALKEVMLNDYIANDIVTTKRLSCPQDVYVGQPFILSASLLNKGDQDLEVTLTVYGVFNPSNMDFDGSISLVINAGENIDVEVPTTPTNKSYDKNSLALRCELNDNPRDSVDVKGPNGSIVMTEIFNVHQVDA